MPRSKRRHPKKSTVKGPRGRRKGYYNPGTNPRATNPLKKPGASFAASPRSSVAVPEAP